MKIKVSEATPLQLDWLVASIEYPMDTDVIEFRLSDVYAFSAQ